MVPRRASTHTVEDRSGNSKQSLIGGSAATAIIQRTHYVCSSTFNSTASPIKFNNISAPYLMGKELNIN